MLRGRRTFSLMVGNDRRLSSRRLERMLRGRCSMAIVSPQTAHGRSKLGRNHTAVAKSKATSISVVGMIDG